VRLQGEQLNKDFLWDFPDLCAWVRLDRCQDKMAVPGTVLPVVASRDTLQCGDYIISVSAFKTRKGSILPGDLHGTICSRDWLGYWRVDFDDFTAHVSEDELKKLKKHDDRLPPTCPGGLGFADHSGSGNALAQAYADMRSIKGVVWYTRQLEDGIAGRVGILHSFLALFCSGEQEPDYVLEKANATKDHGIFVSDWMEVKQGGKALSQYCALSRENVKDQIVMSQLIKMALKMGPYDVLKCNCHHTAMRVYNSCVSTPNMVMVNMPNSSWSTLVETIATWVPFDLFQVQASTETQSGESASNSAEASARVGAAATEAANRQIRLELKDER
jgi:hypothetical protein